MNLKKEMQKDGVTGYPYGWMLWKRQQLKRKRRRAALKGWKTRRK